MLNILDFIKSLITDKGINDAIGCDMTLGRGNDTVFLASICKHVYSFDIQKEAIDYCKDTIKNTNITYICDSHENIKKYVNTGVDFVMYNLGYLPKGDKSITTNSSSTIKSINEVLDLLNIGGIITIGVYTGHDNGKEAKDVESYLLTLDQKKYNVLKYDFINRINNSPYLIAIEKIK